MKKIIEILKELNPKNNYEGSEDFVSDGLIDSMDMQDLFARLEEEYNVEFAGTDLTPQNFTSVEAIRDLLKRRGVDGDV
ncbi:MAG: acyl carrier protein [Selenomonadaceae bacterium]|nr:acyl carrier protein [Selenomonadaceae bacterium]